MSRKAARFTQADVARAIRAAQQTGAGAVLLLPDGTIKIEIEPTQKQDDPTSSEIIVL